MGAEEPKDTENEILWGAEQIGAAICRNKRQAFYLLEKGLIKSARKIGSQYVADRKALRAEFGSAA